MGTVEEDRYSQWNIPGTQLRGFIYTEDKEGTDMDARHGGSVIEAYLTFNIRRLKTINLEP